MTKQPKSPGEDQRRRSAKMLLLKPIPRCPSATLFCDCPSLGVCSQTVFLFTDAEILARGFEPPLPLTPDMEYRP